MTADTAGAAGAPDAGGLLPTTELGSDEFEDFTQRLLNAHRFCSGDVVHVTQVERWGRRGDKQDGIDFAGRLSDGRTAAWQCKRYRTFTVADVRAAIAAYAFAADTVHLVLSCEASAAVRAEVHRHPGWVLIDRRDLGGLLEDLPLHQRRDVLDATWGTTARKQLLHVPTEDVFMSLSAFRRFRSNEGMPLNDRVPLHGRAEELARLETALDRSRDWPPVVLVSGPGGRGKTRLVTEALALHGAEDLGVPIICLADGRLPGEGSFVEIPAGDSIVLIDDANRDALELPALIGAARRNPGLQLVLTARANGVDRVRSVLIEAGFREEQLEHVLLGELGVGEARRLVRDLLAGLQVHPGIVAYLNAQATHSPHVAVIASNLLRHGLMEGPFGLNADIRAQVLARYRDVLIGDTSGLGRQRTTTFLAVLAALGDVELDDAPRWEDIGRFCDIAYRDVLELRRTLRERGVLRLTQGGVRVVPEIFAEQLLEGEAVVDGADTGFIRRFWEAFGGPDLIRPMLTIAELDWRLTQQELPSVVDVVWVSLAENVNTASVHDLIRLLPKLSPLAYTQPVRLIDLLDRIRSRATEADARDTSAERDSADDDDDVEAIVRRMTGRPPLSAIDVERAIPAAYAQCAVTHPPLLERVLTVLWDLGQDDPRSPNQTPTHAHRLITDRFLQVGELPAADVPTRIIAWVREALDSDRLAEHAPELLGMLKPLIAKAGARTEMVSRRQLRFIPFAIDPSRVREIRDDLRDLLRTMAGTSVRVDATIATLLGEAIRPPIGHFGMEITAEQAMKWEGDDLESIGDLRALAEQTDSGVLRRHVRAQVGWDAEHSISATVRFEAHTLLWDLDQLDDELEDLLLNETLSGPSSQKGRPLPALRWFQDEIRRESTLGEDERAADIQARVDRHMSEMDARAEAVVPALLADLAATGTVEESVRRVESAAREVQQISSGRRPFLWSLARGVGDGDRDCIEAVLRVVEARNDSVLDSDLGPMIGRWAANNRDAMLQWSARYASMRPAVRAALGQTMAEDGWQGSDPRVSALREAGLADLDAYVRETFLRAEYRTMAEHPRETVETLDRYGTSEATRRLVLQMAVGAAPAGWAARLGARDADAILRFLPSVGWSEWTAGQVLAGIASAHPRLVMDYLTDLAAAGERLPSTDDGLAAPLDHEQVSAWLLELVSRPDPDVFAPVVRLAVGNRMANPLADTLCARIEDLDAIALVALVEILHEVPTWSSEHVHLAEAMLHRSRRLGVADTVLAAVCQGARIGSWSATNGVSPELDRASSAATVAADRTTDSELRALYSSVIEEASADREWIRSRHDDEDDDDVDGDVS